MLVFNSYLILYLHRLDINLKNGKDEDSDILLHMSIRFDDDIIVRNTRNNMIWGPEERDDNLHPFTSPNPVIPGNLILNV